MPEHYTLEEFRRRRFDYRQGHHVGVFGPTQIAGKTTVSYALLEAVVQAYERGELNVTSFCMKHQDRIIGHWTSRLGFRETPHWPPEPKLAELPIFKGKPAGYTLWPRQSLTNVAADNALLKAEFTSALTWNRAHTPSISHANELYGMLAELGLRQLLTAIVTRDSVAGHGLWYECQKPSGTQGQSIPGFFFNSCEHMLMSKDGDHRNGVRYGEIACGIDPRHIERETQALDPFSWLYIRRSGPQMCIIDAYDSSLAL